jgi:hypothetical protein
MSETASWNRHLLDQLTWHYENQLRPRFASLTDDELDWLPPVDLGRHDVTTIAWRLHHIADALATRATSHFGRPDRAVPAPSTAETALAALEEEYAGWVAGVSALGDEGLLRPCGPAEGAWASAPMATLVTHLHKEVIHHGAEVALLRDLYAAQPV